MEEVEVKGREVGLSRAFSDIELEELLKASPDYRSIAYLTAFHADIWQGELAKLKWGYINFKLEDSSYFSQGIHHKEFNRCQNTSDNSS